MAVGHAVAIAGARERDIRELFEEPDDFSRNHGLFRVSPIGTHVIQGYETDPAGVKLTCLFACDAVIARIVVKPHSMWKLDDTLAARGEKPTVAQPFRAARRR
jgi:hypothetical protein